MRRAICVVFPLLLAGCGLPPAITIASYAIDGFSYVSTGKGVGDHALSAVAEKDCAVWRVIRDERVCRKYRKGEHGILVALAENSEPSYPGEESGVTGAADSRGVQAATQTAAADPVVIPAGMSDLLPALEGVAAVEPPIRTGTALFSNKRPRGPARYDDDDMVLRIPLSPKWKPVLSIKEPPAATKPEPQTGNTVLVLGSYRKIIIARRAAGTWKKFRPVVVAANVKGGTYFRVVTGPFSPAAISARRNALKTEGLRGVWAARLCPPGGEEPGCIALPGVAGSAL